MKPLYWVIKADLRTESKPDQYWLEEGGIDPRQGKAERFQTHKLAKKDRDKWCHPGEKAYLVRIIARRST